MNYKKHYDLLINRAKERQLEGYSERHHIIPKCMGGTNDKDNLVRLTPEEHYVAHQLLVKIYPKNNKLIAAVILMSGNSIKTQRSNKLYGWLRRQHSLYGSKPPSHKGKVRSIENKIKISNALKGSILSEERKAKISNTLKGRTQSEETKKKKSKSLIGKQQHNKGKSWKINQETGKREWFNNDC